MSTPYTPEPHPAAPQAEPATEAQPTTQFQSAHEQQLAFAQQQQQAQHAQQAQQQAQHAQQIHQQGAYVAPPQPPVSRDTTLGGTNTFAFLAIIFAFITPLAGIIFGHMGLSQIKRTGDAGRGIALTGLIISYASFILLTLAVITYMVLIFSIMGMIGSSVSSFADYPMPS